MYSQWFHRLLFTLIGCGIGPLSMAQRAAVAPLVPIAPAIQLVKPVKSVQLPAWNSSSALPLAVAPLRQPAWPGPLFILNSSVIIDLANSEINPQDIADLYVYKGADASLPLPWRSLVNYGIIAVNLKPKVKLKIASRSLAEIGKWLAISGPVSYSINGMPAGDSHLRIATTAIEEIKVTPADADAPMALVAIKIANRVRHESPAPPGTIRIRGTAAL